MNLLPSLRYLVALNEHRHFGRAAQACHITQPALSNALRALEEEFAAVIVKRERNYVGLTPEGEIILASAQRMLHEHALLQESLKGDALAPHGPLRIGAVPTAVPVAARFAAMLQARQNGIRPIVLSLSSAELEKGLETLSLDLAMGYIERMDSKGARLSAIAQYTEHYFLLRRADSPQADGLRIGDRQALCGGGRAVAHEDRHVVLASRHQVLSLIERLDRRVGGAAVAVASVHVVDEVDVADRERKS